MPQQKKALIIENKADRAQWFQEVLEKEGFTIILSNDGLDGLQKAKSEIPDLVILNLLVPNLDGYRISAFIKRNKTLKNTKILATSAIITPESHMLMEEAGIDLFMDQEKDEAKLREKLALLVPQETLTS